MSPPDRKLVTYYSHISLFSCLVWAAADVITWWSRKSEDWEYCGPAWISSAWMVCQRLCVVLLSCFESRSFAHSYFTCTSGLNNSARIAVTIYLVPSPFFHHKQKSLVAPRSGPPDSSCILVLVFWTCSPYWSPRVALVCQSLPSDWSSRLALVPSC